MEKMMTENEFMPDFSRYIQQFKALSDEKRIKIMHLLAIGGEECVCDLEEKMALPQSKLSYHLNILRKAELIKKETRGTWSYYSLNETELDSLLSEELCCVLKPAKDACC